MRVGGVVSSSPGDPQDQILSVVGDIVGGNVLRLRVDPGRYRSKFYALFVNGTYTGNNYRAPLKGLMTISYPIPSGTVIGSAYVEDAGDAPVFGDYVPSGPAEDFDADSATRLKMVWTANYSQSTVRGDTQLSSIVITGASRSTNVLVDELLPTRGALTYSISNPTGTDYIVRWFAGDRLVAEGSRTGNGAVTCSEMNASGLSVACVLAFTAELKPGTATIELRWPKSYQVHYSTGALVYPRTPEATVADVGSDSYLYLTGILAGGSYNYNILAVDDEGDVQTTIQCIGIY